MALGLILAGGRSQRFGSDKALARLDGVTLLERVLARLAPACVEVAVSAPPDGPTEALAHQLGLTCLEDPAGSPRGPLSGILAGLAWAQGRDDVLLTLPCDAPLLPAALPARRLAAAEGAPCAVARSPRGLQPLCAAWRAPMLRVLRSALTDGLHPPVQQLLRDAGAALVDCPDDGAFLNINSVDDLAEAERRLRDEA
jgi:molybdenum cofactor guanylyltransferase